jgi:molybdopterin synthase catalytic subunit
LAFSSSQIRVQTGDFDISTELALIRSNANVGAVASFIGLVRDLNDGSGVSSLTLEHYPLMTEKALAGIVAEAEARWPVLYTTVIHRFGELKPTDQIVMVIVATSHRKDAFAACEFIMDYLKTQAPFWKKEQTPDGSRWVEAREADAAAASRWHTKT